MKRERTPPNAEGDFYVQEGTCLNCMAPHHEAPELMGHDGETGCYFKRQPATPGETKHAVKAVRVSCVEALRYGGRNPLVLARLWAKRCGHLCDVLSRDRT